MFKKLISGIFALIICGHALSAQATWEGTEVTGTVFSSDFPGYSDWSDPVSTISFTDIEFIKVSVNATRSADFTENMLILTYENTSPWPNITFGPLTYTFELQEASISAVSLVNSTFSSNIVSSFTSNSITLEVALQNTNPGELFTATFEIVQGTLSPNEALLDMSNYIFTIPEDEFKNNADNRKNALSNKIIEVIDTIELADTEVDPTVQNGLYDEAIAKLENDISAKMDGCLGGNEKNDWIVDCNAQTDLNELIDDIITIINDLKN